MKLIERMPVKRIKAEDGSSRCEPVYDRTWDAEKRIAWALGVMHADIGLEAKAYNSAYTLNGIPAWPYHYGLSFPGRSIDSGTADETVNAITYLTLGYELGVEATTN